MKSQSNSKSKNRRVKHEKGYFTLNASKGNLEKAKKKFANAYPFSEGIVRFTIGGRQTGFETFQSNHYHFFYDGPGGQVFERRNATEAIDYVYKHRLPHVPLYDKKHLQEIFQ